MHEIFTWDKEGDLKDNKDCYFIIKTKHCKCEICIFREKV